MQLTVGEGSAPALSKFIRLGDRQKKGSSFSPLPFAVHLSACVEVLLSIVLNLAVFGFARSSSLLLNHNRQKARRPLRASKSAPIPPLDFP